MDKPNGMPDTPAGIPRDGMRQPVAEGRQGTVGERRVSERPTGAPMRPMRPTGEAGGIAGPVGACRSLDSRRATVDVSFSGGAVAAAGPGLPGGADRSSQPAEQPPGFLTTFTRLRSLESQYRDQRNREPAERFLRAVRNLSKVVVRRYTTFIGSVSKLPWSEGGILKAERAYAALREKARQAELGGDLEQADSIREELKAIDWRAAKELQTLSTRYGPTASSSPRSPPLPSATNPPALDWGLVHPQLAGIQQYFTGTCQPQHAKYFGDCLKRMQAQIRRVFKTHGDWSMLLPMSGKHPPRAVQMYRLLEDMARRTEAEGGATPPGRIREELDAINDKAAWELRWLTWKFGPLETLAALAGVPVQQAPGQVQPAQPAGTSAVGVLPPPQPVHPAPERAGTGAVAVPPVADPFSEPPGPSSRIMPAPAVGSPQGPAREQLPAHRRAIVERLKSGEALAETRSILVAGGAEALGFSPEQTRVLLEDLDRLHRFDGQHPAALADIDWVGIEALVAILDFVPPPP